MIAALVTGLALGLVAGLVPGAYTALVAGRALQRGLRAALPLALVPLVTEVPPLLAASFALVHLNPSVLRWVGVVGGVLFVALGVRLYRHGVPEAAPEADPREEARTWLGVATAGLLSPAPWLFWFIVAGPLLVRRYRLDGFGAASLQAGVFLVAMMGAAAGLAWAASHGRRLPLRWQRRLLQGAAGFLVVAGSLLTWRAAVGDLEALMVDQAAVHDLLP